MACCLVIPCLLARLTSCFGVMWIYIKIVFLAMGPFTSPLRLSTCSCPSENCSLAHSCKRCLCGTSIVVDFSVRMHFKTSFSSHWLVGVIAICPFVQYDIALVTLKKDNYRGISPFCDQIFLLT